jgi:hypothetical protein
MHPKAFRRVLSHARSLNRPFEQVIPSINIFERRNECQIADALTEKQGFTWLNSPLLGHLFIYRGRARFLRTTLPDTSELLCQQAGEFAEARLPSHEMSRIPPAPRIPTEESDLAARPGQRKVAAIIHDAMMEASKTTDHVYLQKVIRTNRFCNYHAKGYAGKAWASAVTRNC